MNYGNDTQTTSRFFDFVRKYDAMDWIELNSRIKMENGNEKRRSLC
jgi:hypothetical protein